MWQDKDGNDYEFNGETFVICYWDLIEAGELIPNGTDWKWVVTEEEAKDYFINYN